MVKMEEVQSWWEVPTVAHFCYVFRSAFNLLFFEIAELESVLLDMQDPEMCASLDQLIVRLLQGCYKENISEENWNEKLQELFDENCDDGENPFDSSLHFLQLSPRAKIEVLLKLCEFRLDTEEAQESIKNIPSEDMQAKYLGKDNDNYSYWYFCDERLYKEASSNKSGKKIVAHKTKDSKQTLNNTKQTAERRAKIKSSINTSWSIVCNNLTDWEDLIKKLSKSKSLCEKNLLDSLKSLLPVVQENIAEKERLLRKRFMELAPKRASSRISKVQERKKIEELKAQEAAKKARIEFEKEQARKEELKKETEMKERARRAEDRRKAVEERAERAKIREQSRVSESEDEESTDSSDDNQKKSSSWVQRTFTALSRKHKSSTSSESDESQSSGSEEESRISSNKAKKNSSRSERYHFRTNIKTQNKKYKYQESTESENESESEAEMKYNSRTRRKDNLKPRNTRKKINYKECNSESDSASSDHSEKSNESSDSRNLNDSDFENSDINQKRNNKSDYHQNVSKSFDTKLKNLPQRVAIQRSSVLRDSGVCKWNSSHDSRQKVLHNSCNISSKRIKLEGKANFTSIKSISKENQAFQTFNENGKITKDKVSTTPSIIRLSFVKPNLNKHMSS